MKKFLSLFMALVMVFSMAPTAFANESESIILIDTVATTKDASEAWDGVPFEAVAPGDGNITVTFDDTTDVVPEYRVTIDGDSSDGWQNCLYDGSYTNTYMVSEGDTILVEVCTQVNGDYAAGSIPFTVVFTPVAASGEVETVSGTASFETATTASTGKVIEYTAPSSGTVAIELTPYDGIYVEYKVALNDDDGRWFYTYDGDGTTQSVDVTRGDTVVLVICTMSNSTTYAAGTVDYKLVFTPSGVDDGSGDSGSEIENELFAGSNDISISAGSQFSVDYTFVPTETGTLELSLSALTMISPFDGATDVTEFISDYLGSVVLLFVDGERYDEPVSVTANKEVTISFYQSRMYSNSNYAWNAVLDIAVKTEQDGGNSEIGNIDFSIAAGETSSSVYTFVAPQSGLLTIDVTKLIRTTPSEGSVDVTESADDFLGGIVYIKINDDQTYYEPVEVTEGDTISVYLTQSPMYATHNYAWDATFAISINSPDVAEPTELVLGENSVVLAENEKIESVTCFYNAEQSGTLVIDIPIYMSVCEGEVLYSENPFDALTITVNGTVIDSLPHSVDVTEGDTVTIVFSKIGWTGIGYEVFVELSYELGEVEPTELWEGENFITLAEDERVQYLSCFHTATETGTLTIDVPLYMSICGDETIYGENFLESVSIYVNGNFVEELPYSVSVTAGDTVNFVFYKNGWAGIGYLAQVNLSYELGEVEPTVIYDGENYINIPEDSRVKNLTCVYTATETGTLEFNIPLIMSVCDMEYEYVDDVLDALSIYINDTAVEALPGTVDVTEGDVVTVVFEKNWWSGIGFQLQLMVSYQLPEAEATVLFDGPNYITLAEDERVESLTCVYTATETGTLTIDVPLYISMCGDEQLYGEDFLEDVSIYVNNVFVEALPYSVDVTEGDVVTIKFVKNWWTGIGYLAQVDLSYALGEVEPTVLTDGENSVSVPEDSRVESLTCVYTATETGALEINVTSITSVCDGEYENVDDVLDALTIYVNDTIVEALPYSVDVTEGDTVTIVFEKNWWTGIGFELDVTLSYESVLYGDANGDGKVNVADANLVRRYAAKLIGEDDLDLAAADVNGDGKVNVADANLIRRYAAKLIEVFPVEE